MNTQIKSPDGFCRVAEITKNSSDQNALYDAIAAKQIAHARLGTGHASVVFVHRESAIKIVERRMERRTSPPVIHTVDLPPPDPKSFDVISTIVSSMETHKSHMNVCLKCLHDEQVETNRLLCELLTVWNGK